MPTIAGRSRLFSRLVAALALSLPGLLLTSHASAQDKYALSVFHFNVQYVAGGMVGFWPTNTPKAGSEPDAEQVEDQIVRESFEPVLDLYAKHPTWGADLELQGYMLDVMQARHPDVLAKLRNLAKSGQVEVVSFHYSDQLFIAYPSEPWKRSEQLNKQTFKRLDIPLASSVFCQEGQSSVGMASAMKSAGYTTMIWPKNLWKFQHDPWATAPLYKFGDGFLVAGGQGVTYDKDGVSLEVVWPFLDDGELLATGDVPPYMPTDFKKNPAAIAKFEAKLQALADDGFQITTVKKYVDAVKDKVTAKDLPELLDGTWQPQSTVGVWKWLGGQGLWQRQERDNEVRTLGSIAQRELEAAEALAEHAHLDAHDRIDAAWRLLSLGMVTDASGINPFRGEVEYGIAHETEALRIAREVIRDAKAAMNQERVTISSDTGEVTEGAQSEPVDQSVDEPPLALKIEAGDRGVTTRWTSLGAGHWKVEVRVAAGDGRSLRVTFPGKLADEFAVTRALHDDEVFVQRRSSFTFDSFHFALPIGLIGLEPNRFVIEDQGYVHVAAQLFREKGGLLYWDKTLREEEPVVWVFHVVDGTPEQALDVAKQLNVYRRLVR